MKKDNKRIFFANKAAKNYWNWWILREAWKNLSRKQLQDEIRYINALLDFSRFGALFPEKTKGRDYWGRRSKDLVYGYWTEEDLRLKLAAELNNYPNCQIHGQVHIHGTKRKGRLKRKNVSVSSFPDILFMALKKRERSYLSKEKNIESSAIELKFFSQGWNKEDLKNYISEDLDKLKNYQRKRFHPRVDNGFFLCIDESGRAEEVLEELFKKKKYNRKALGYGVIVPRFSNEGMYYPRILENYERGEERRIVYLLNYVHAKLEKFSSNTYFGVRQDKHYKDFYIYIYKDKKSIGWLILVSPNKFANFNKNHLAVILHLPSSCLPNKFKLYQFVEKEEKYIEQERIKTKYGDMLIYKININYLDSLSDIEWYGDKLASIVKKVVNKSLKNKT